MSTSWYHNLLHSLLAHKPNSKDINTIKFHSYSHSTHYTNGSYMYILYSLGIARHFT